MRKPRVPKWARLALLPFLLLLVACGTVSASDLAAHEIFDPTPTVVIIAIPTAAPIATPAPTATPQPPPTPVPTATPQPTATPMALSEVTIELLLDALEEHCHPYIFHGNPKVCLLIFDD